MELGADAVLVNTALQLPKTYGRSFRMAVIAGRKAYEAKLAQQYKHAVASSPLTAFLHQ
jgi:thiazole synthase